MASRAARRDEYRRGSRGGPHRDSRRKPAWGSGAGRDRGGTELSPAEKQQNGAARADALQRLVMYNTYSGLDALDQLEETGSYRVKHRWDAWATGAVAMTVVFYELNEKVIVLASVGQWWTKDEVQALYHTACASHTKGFVRPTEQLCLKEAMSSMVAAQMRLPCYPPLNGAWTYTGRWAKEPLSGREQRIFRTPHPPPAPAPAPAPVPAPAPALPSEASQHKAFSKRAEANAEGETQSSQLAEEPDLQSMPDRPPPSEPPERNAEGGFGRLTREALDLKLADQSWGDIWGEEQCARIFALMSAGPGPDHEEGAPTDASPGTAGHTEEGEGEEEEEGHAGTEARPAEKGEGPKGDPEGGEWKTVVTKPRRSRPESGHGGGNRWRQGGAKRGRGRR